MNYGFIYCLGNEAMPSIFKIGMTERAPSQRVQELSGSTSIPLPFELLCFGEVEDPRGTEASIHAHFSSCRVNAGREFFRGSYSGFAEIIQEYATTFAETDEGAIRAHKERLFYNYIHAGSLQERARALIEAAAFEGNHLWAEGEAIHSTGCVCRYSWIGCSLYSLREELLQQLPATRPESRVSRLLRRKEGETA